MLRSLLLLLTLALAAAACSDDPAPDAGAGSPDGGQVARPDALPGDAPSLDAAAPDAAAADAAADDAAAADAAPEDAAPQDAAAPDAEPADAGGGTDARTFNCGVFTGDPGWTVDPGFRAVVIADANDGLADPVALAFARGAFGDRLYVVNQGNSTLAVIDTDTGTTTALVSGSGWAVPPSLLTTITWDRSAVFDGQLYVGDQGSDGDNDSRIYRVDPAGVNSVYTQGPGAGLDDIYGLAFVPSGSGYTSGLYVTGDTDGAGVDWGLFNAVGTAAPFSEVAGVEGLAVDTSTVYGGLMYAARPLGGGYAGDGTITPIMPDGSAGTPLASGLGGVHANVFAPGGTYGASMYAASWSAGQLLRISPSGTVTVVASGLQLTNYDGNILDFSPDGNVLFVADRLNDRVVCIEPL